jgi:hypothetical protein
VLPLSEFPRFETRQQQAGKVYEKHGMNFEIGVVRIPRILSKKRR